ncbi:hypothetical protein CK219_00370 [Mesorhizobium sp. WSM4313]|nr:hypothetical protein CK219_00370 [Mesorhizobium sp. WSM4313]
MVAATSACVAQYALNHISLSATAGPSLLGFGCNIKGDISNNTGNRIYHLPSQRYYNSRIITPSKGERWFCGEAEAQAAGWRKARR